MELCNEYQETMCGECACQERVCSEYRKSATMNARILRVNNCQLLVCDLGTSQEVLVHTDKACCFRAGQCVCIEYSGAMTMSIPPQITASCVKLLNNNGGCRCRTTSRGVNRGSGFPLPLS